MTTDHPSAPMLAVSHTQQAIAFIMKGRPFYAEDDRSPNEIKAAQPCTRCEDPACNQLEPLCCPAAEAVDGRHQWLWIHEHGDNMGAVCSLCGKDMGRV